MVQYSLESDLIIELESNRHSETPSEISSASVWSPPREGGGGYFFIRGLIELCCWLGSHFHDWIDYNGVAFST